jgi:hypothetical protein
MFISHVGAQGYKILKNLCVPLNPRGKSYTHIVAILKGNFAPKRLIIVERFKFFKRDQLPHKSIGNYIVELKKLSKGCKFGTFLKESLRDRLVCGLKDEQIQRKLYNRNEFDLRHCQYNGIEHGSHIITSKLHASSFNS